MKPKLLDNKTLEWSPIVANNAMNRERIAFGVNSYEKDIGLNPVEFLEKRSHKTTIQWIDLCCGKGNALIQATNYFKEKAIEKKLSLIGIDLVNYFSSYQSNSVLALKVMNMNDWQPQTKSDLITIVHGLHYVGDKLELITKAVSGLKEDGVFIGNLDLANIKIEGVKAAKTILLPFFKKYGIQYDNRKKIIKCHGNKNLRLNFTYLGADDKAGANYTGQPVVDAYYRFK